MPSNHDYSIRNSKNGINMVFSHGPVVSSVEALEFSVHRIRSPYFRWMRGWRALYIAVKQMDQRRWWQEFISNSFIGALCYFLKRYLLNFSWNVFLVISAWFSVTYLLFFKHWKLNRGFTERLCLTMFRNPISSVIRLLRLTPRASGTSSTSLYLYKQF